ncbi:YbaB/EbfC family nucleoid-associated protein [Salininema proteolyticum]|uniref:YbaB/EbfC family nucleoid-associated protein n=1 Tax=Salininema proteolyticum TaxID=1607685 RepID=A0ABV8U3Q1_9ACTN
MDFEIDDTPGAKRNLEDIKQRTQALANDAQVAGDALKEISASAKDAKGNVEFTLSSQGAITEVSLSEGFRRNRPEENEQAILEAYRNAQSSLVEQAQEAITEALGKDSQAGKAIAKGFRQRTMPVSDSD